MSTKAQITTAIDAKIRNKTPLVVKVEHADVEQLITDEMFPAPVVVEWDGTAPVSPTTDIICGTTLNSASNVKFKVFFWKQGNDVFFSGVIENISASMGLNLLLLINFPTTLYKPLITSAIKTPIISSYDQIVKQIITVDSNGIQLSGGLPALVGATTKYYFNGTYKVAN